MHKNGIKDVNIRGYYDIMSPEEVIGRIPLTENAIKTIDSGREQVKRIIKGADLRKIVIVGPCSIHDVEAAQEYGHRLVELAPRVEDQMLVIMRQYFEKPRTSIGWKGLTVDPHMDGSNDMEHGIQLARKLLVDMSDIGLPAATEILGPNVAQYLSDAIVWAAIGARTTESQTHRELASGLSMPIGYKNGTKGGIDTAINALITGMGEHVFYGPDYDNRLKKIETTGNMFGHIILRGGNGGPNYDEESVRSVYDLLSNATVPNSIKQRLIQEELSSDGTLPLQVMIDCSHANSGKDYRRQPEVLENVIKQIEAGNEGIIGVMIESNLKGGRQELKDPKKLEYGKSITDGCIDWDTTYRVLMDAYRQLQLRPQERKIPLGWGWSGKYLPL